jgi:HlyD family secretion protein
MTMNAESPNSNFTLRIRSALFEIAAHEPESAPRWMLWSIAFLSGLLLVWSVFAQLDIVAVAEGRLVPQTYVKVVQPAEAGIVREILVDEGDEVTAGQVLLRLDPTENIADSTATERELATQNLQVRRIDAELSGKSLKRLPTDDAQQFALADAQRAAHRQAFLDSIAQETATRDRAKRELAASLEVLSKLEQTLPSYERSATAYEQLASKQLMGSMQAEEKRREAVEKSQDLRSQQAMVSSQEAAVRQSNERLAQLKSSYESDLHSARLEALNRINQLEKEHSKLKFRQTHLELRAPQAGKVKELATTTVGAVVQPGTVLLSLVPVKEPLFAEVSIRNDDIGVVREGQPVRVKLAAFPFQKYGMLEGVVKTVSADSSADEARNTMSGEARGGAASDLGLTFKALVELKQQGLLLGGRDLPIASGMQLSAEIIQGERTVLEYLLSPVQRMASEAGMER